MSTDLPVIPRPLAAASAVDFDEKLAAYGLELCASSVDRLCRNLVSVDWTGKLYDCDFNQMLDLRVAPELPQTIADFNPERFAARRIMTGSHCFGCTAGAGSSVKGCTLMTLTLACRKGMKELWVMKLMRFVGPAI